MLKMRAQYKYYDNCFKICCKCEVLGLNESFKGSCFGHVFPKHVNIMLLLMKKFEGISSLFQSSLPN